MKQTTILCKAFLFFLFVLGFCNDSMADEDVIKTNWYNSMTQYAMGDDDWCLEVPPDNLIMFDLTVQFADPVIDKYPRMKFYYKDVLNGNFGYTDTVSNAMVQYSGFRCGIHIWEATFTITMNMAEQCAINSLFCAEMQVQLLTDEDPKNMGTDVAYPYLDNSDQFPAPEFDITGNNGRSNYWQIFKEVCCDIGGPPGPGDPCNGLNGVHVRNNGISPFQPPVWLIGNTGNRPTQNQLPANKKIQNPITMEIDKLNLQDIQASPNPFNDQVKLRLKAKDLAQVEIDCFDTHGRTMSLNILEGSEYVYLRTTDWMPGIYYLRLRNSNEVKTIKLIKTE